MLKSTVRYNTAALTIVRCVLDMGRSQNKLKTFDSRENHLDFTNSPTNDEHVSLRVLVESFLLKLVG